MNKDVCKKISIADVVFFIGMVIALAMYLSKIKLGMADLDEVNYLCIPFRILKGDTFISDEWHVTQLAAYILYPYLKIYMKLVGHTEGIVLSFRYIFLCVYSITAIMGYVLLRSKNAILSSMTSILFVLFVPYGIMAMSYNSNGYIMAFIFACLNFSDYRNSKWSLLLQGFVLSLLVLCNPYMIVVALAYVVSFIVALLRKESIKKWIYEKTYIVIGGMINALLWGMLVITRSDLRTIYHNIPYVMGDSVHGGNGLKEFFDPIVGHIVNYPYLYSFIVLACVCGAFAGKYRKHYFVVVSVIILVATVTLAFSEYDGIWYSSITIPFSALGITAFIYGRDKDYRLLNWYVLGIAYSICLNKASNNGMFAFANGTAVSMLASIWMIYEYLNSEMEVCKVDADWNNIKRHKWFIAFCVIIILQFGIESIINYRHIFWEPERTKLTSKVEVGPLKGIYTTEEEKNLYTDEYNNVITIEVNENDQVMEFNHYISGYLLMDKGQVGAPSTWLADNVRTVEDEYLIKYYMLHPDRIPTVIYVDSLSAYNYWSLDEWKQWSECNSYELETFDNGALALRRKSE